MVSPADAGAVPEDKRVTVAAPLNPSYPPTAIKFPEAANERGPGPLRKGFSAWKEPSPLPNNSAGSAKPQQLPSSKSGLPSWFTSVRKRDPGMILRAAG